jgi:hypothetical protein
MCKNASAHTSNDENKGKEQGKYKVILVFSLKRKHISKLTTTLIACDAIQIEIKQISSIIRVKGFWPISKMDDQSIKNHCVGVKSISETQSTVDEA